MPCARLMALDGYTIDRFVDPSKWMSTRRPRRWNQEVAILSLEGIGGAVLAELRLKKEDCRLTLIPALSSVVTDHRLIIR